MGNALFNNKLQKNNIACRQKYVNGNSYCKVEINYGGKL